MDNKKILLGIFLVFIVLFSSNMAFAEDVSDDISHQDNIIAISENDNIQTASQQTISAGSNSTTIQNTINNKLARHLFASPSIQDLYYWSYPDTHCKVIQKKMYMGPTLLWGRSNIQWKQDKIFPPLID